MKQVEPSIFANQQAFGVKPTSTLLAGLRLGVKDLFDVAGIPTGAGNPDWLASHPIPSHTSSVVEALLKAGAEYVGKTQTDELAYSLNGTNVHYGTPVNPVAPSRLPGGSSSGSAVAVAKGLIDIGLGTDTGGSIRVPSSYNGLFGLRPTHGEIPMDNMVPLAPMFDTVGWMTRDLATLTLVAQCILPQQSISSPRQSKVYKVAVLHPEVQGNQLWHGAHQTWLNQQTWAEDIRQITLSTDWLAQASECFRVLQGYNLWQTHRQWLLESVPVFSSDIQARLDWCQGLTIDDFEQALIKQKQLYSEINSWFAQVDFVLLPTTPSISPLLDASAEWMANYRSELMGLTAPAGLAGLPQLHLPVLTKDNAPYGVSILGPKYSEHSMLACADLLISTGFKSLQEDD